MQKKLYERQAGQPIENELAINTIIAQSLLLQEADERGLILSLEGIEERLEEQLAERDTTLEELKEQTKQNGDDYDEVIVSYGKQLAIQDLTELIIEERTPEDFDLDQAVRDFYNDAISGFAEGAQVPNFAETKPQIEQLVQQQNERQIMDDFIKELRENSEVTIH